VKVEEGKPIKSAMKNNHDHLIQLTRQVADRLMLHPWKLWFWGDSIGLEGLLDAATITGDERYYGYVYGILKTWAARKNKGGDRDEWEYTAAGVALIRVYEKSRDPALLRLAIDFADYLNGFRKSDSGIPIRYENAMFELPPEMPEDHPEASATAAKMTKAKNGGPCAFVDTMHFDAPFFSALYRTTGEDKYAHWALATIHAQIQLLQDPATGLFHHFWIEQTRQPNGVFWGRGNGWAILGLIHTLLYLKETSFDCQKLKESLTRQMKAMAELQDQSGHWRTVLNDPQSYLETSIAAFVVDGFSLAIREGWLSRDYQGVVEKAMEASISSVQVDGLVGGVSFETFPSTLPEHYRTMPRGAMVPWGQGPFLTAIASYLQAGDSNS
jgi:unsaturated rhamnogalacturonyl hydrolase